MRRRSATAPTRLAGKATATARVTTRATASRENEIGGNGDVDDKGDNVSEEERLEIRSILESRGVNDRPEEKVESMDTIDVEELRRLQNYSVIARWMVRVIDLNTANEALTKWQHEGAFLSGLPEIKEGLFEPQKDCKCDLCQGKRSYMQALHQFHTALDGYHEELEGKKSHQLKSDGIAQHERKPKQDRPMDDMPKQKLGYNDVAMHPAQKQIEGGLFEDDLQQEQLDDADALVAGDLKQKLEEEVKAENANFLARLTSDVALAFIQNCVATRQASINREMDLAAKLAAKDEQLAAKDEQLAAKDEQLAAQLAAKDEQIAEIKATKDVAAAAAAILNASAVILGTAKEVEAALLNVVAKISHYAGLGNNTPPSYNVSCLNLDPTRINEEIYPQLSNELFDKEPLELDTTGAMNDLETFQKILSDAFEVAELVEKDDDDYAEKMADTQLAICCVDLSSGSLTNLCVPVAGAVEKKGYHPILSSILYRVASMAKSQSELRQPVSNQILHEHALWAGTKMPTRIIDFVVQQVEECYRAVLPYSCFVPVEVKPVKRSKTSLSVLHEQGAHQVLGHLAKQIFHYFHLGGIGSNHKCFGVVLTLVSVEVIELELLNVGTKRVAVIPRRTGPHFLFDMATTEHLLGDDQEVPPFKFDASRPWHGLAMLASVMRRPSHEASPLLDGELWFQDGQGPPTESPPQVDQIPPASDALSHDDHSPQNGLPPDGQARANKSQAQDDQAQSESFSQDEPFQQESVHNDLVLAERPVQGDEEPHFRVLELLGAGGFCYVYKLDDKSYIKIARSPQTLPSVENEMVTVKKLDHVGIPKCPNEELGIVTFRRQCEVSKLSALRLSGLVGVAASKFQSFSKKQLTSIFKVVESALMHAHERQICHLDVRPSNIIVEMGESNNLQVELCDWGCAKSMNGKVKGFCGSLGFAHDEVLLKEKQDEWNPISKYDFASLVFTVVALIAGLQNEMPWSGFCGRRVTEKMLFDRLETSLKVIESSQLDESTKRELQEYLPEKKVAPRRSERIIVKKRKRTTP